MFTRRDILKNILLVGGGSLLALGKNSWAFAADRPAEKRLIVVLLRGAVDGLSVVVPYAEEQYYKLRPTIALNKPNNSGGVLDLDGFFGLHPALSSLLPLWQNKTLAFIHASGSPATTRSHFEAQDILETASLRNFSDPQGWINSLVQQMPAGNSPVQALSIGNVLPKICMGKMNIATMSVAKKAARKHGKALAENQALELLYKNNPELLNLYQDGTSAQAEIMDNLQDDAQSEMEKASKNALRPDGFVNACNKLSALMRKNSRVQIAFLDVGGWDTHINQGNAKGQLAGKLEKLGSGIANLAAGLGDAYNNTAILVMSEFGRTVAENGNGGTDHGHGNVAWLLGGGVQGGKIWTKWPSLARDNLYQQRDLAVTTDFREIIHEVIVSHLQVAPEKAAQIVRNYEADGSLRGIV